MKILTTGYELSTAITNLLLFITSIYIFFNIKNKSYRWFYLFICMDSFLGIIVHGVRMNTTINTILWIILYILFSITFNLLLYIFCNVKLKKVMIISLIVFIVMLITFIIAIKVPVNKLDNIVMLLYALCIVLISLYNIIKSNYKYKYYYIIGIIIQIIGIIPIFINLDLKYIDHNGLCHIFTLIAIVLFYLGVRKKESV